MLEITVIDLITISFAVVAAVFSFITYNNSIVHDRRQATLDAYNQLQEQALDYLNHYQLERILEISQDWRSDEYKKLSGYIARIEHFCVGVNLRVYDRKTLYELSHGYLDGFIKKRIEPIIQKKNYNGLDYYANIHKVYKWMERRARKEHEHKASERTNPERHEGVLHQRRFW